MWKRTCKALSASGRVDPEWFARKGRMFTGYEIKEGDKLVALRENGFRSNGLSLVRKIMNKTYGHNWHEQKYDDKSLAELALHPSKIYTAALVDMFGGFSGEPKTEIHGVVHITGGGVPGKLTRALKPTKLGAYLSDIFEPSSLMLYCQDKGNVSDEEAYKTWNMGQGMIVIAPKPDEVISIATKYGIESKIVGEVVGSPGISIRNRGLRQDKQYLRFSWVYSRRHYFLE